MAAGRTAKVRRRFAIRQLVQSLLPTKPLTGPRRLSLHNAFAGVVPSTMDQQVLIDHSVNRLGDGDSALRRTV